MASLPAAILLSQLLLLLACSPEATGENKNCLRVETRGRWRLQGAGMGRGKQYGNRMGKGPGWTVAGKQRHKSGSDETAANIWSKKV